MTADSSFEARRTRQRLDEQLAQIRATGWIVRVTRDLGDALIVDAIDGEGVCHSMWIDPLDRYALARAAMRELQGRIDTAGGRLTLAADDELRAALLPLLPLLGGV